MDSFVIKWLVSGFGALKWLSPFQLVRSAFPKATPTYGFVDAWVIGHFLLALCAWLVLSPKATVVLGGLLLGYGTLRVFESVTYNLGVLFIHPLAPGDSALRSFRRSVILALHNYVEVIFWFAAAYRYFADHFDNPALVGSVDGALYFSVVTMATVGYGDVVPHDATSRWVVIVHICVSLVFTIVVLARVISLLPSPKSLDPCEWQ